MTKVKLLGGLALFAACATLNLAGAATARAADGGGCGEYKYLHDGKCVDARDKPAKSWSENMSSKPAW